MVNKEKEHHLAADGKCITEGLSGENLGDVNLSEHNGPPFLTERRKQIDEYKKQKINSISSKIDDQLKIRCCTAAKKPDNRLHPSHFRST